MAGSYGTKRNNGQLDKAVKKASGVKDDRRGPPRVSPNTIVSAAFLAVRKCSPSHMSTCTPSPMAL
jgi:hypothetical protein